ncbi:hypothetical protein F5X99DRAFT_405527 [Biscogniauxia marginata]|nr:hypothetical protein F5X99DRAFT_405527 [Biscogniauxia marginata]
MTRTLFGRPLDPSRLAHHVRFQINRRNMGSQSSPRALRTIPSRKTEYTPSRSYFAKPDVYIPPKIAEVCRNHNLSLWTETRGLKVRFETNKYKLNVFFSRRHCIDMKSQKYLDAVEHPFTQSILDIYIAQNGTPLWYNAWSASTMSGASPLPTRKAAKRMQYALRKALEEYGYDREGRKIVTDEPSHVMDLYGTLRVGCGDAKAICNAKAADLLEHAKKIIAAAEMELRRDHTGQHIPSPRSRTKPQFVQRPRPTSSVKPFQFTKVAR